MPIDLYPNIAKVKRGGVYQNLPGFVQQSSDADIEAMIANSEISTTAQYAHLEGSYFILNGVLYKAIIDIAVNDTIAVGTNCEVTNLGDNVSDLKTVFDEITPTYNHSKNLFNKNTMISANGRIISNTGTLAVVATGKYAIIPVSAETQYSIQTGGTNWGAASIGALVYSSSDTEFVKISYVDMSTLPASSTGAGKTFTTPEGCKAVCVNILYGSSYDFTNTLQLEVGGAATTYEPFTKEIIALGGDGIADTKVREELEDFEETLSLSVVPIKNLFDKTSMVTDDKGIGNTGTIIVANGWALGTIPVKPNTKYAISKNENYWIAASIGALSYSTNGTTILSYVDMNTLPYDPTGNGKVFTTPSECNYILLTVKTTTKNYIDTLQVEEGEICTPYSAYQLVVDKIGEKPVYDKISAKQIEALETDTIHKNLVLLGDSITYNADGWVKYFRQRVPFDSFHNFAQSGATWRNQSTTEYDVTNSYSASDPNNVIWNEFNKLVAAVEAENVPIPDCIIILAGTNDQMLWGASYYGTIEEAFASNRNIVAEDANQIVTTCDAIRYNVELIRNKWKNCQVIITTPIQRGITNQTPIFTLQALIKECAKNLGIICIDQTSESGVYGWIEASEHRFLADGVHPTTSGNTNGAEMIGKYLAKRIRQSVSV